MKKLGVCYGVQIAPYYEAPMIAVADGQNVAESTPPVRLALDAGLPIVGGTDSTRVGEFNTWRAIEYLVTGRAAGGSVQRRADYAVERRQVLRFYTANAAWLTFDEETKGNSGSREGRRPRSARPADSDDACGSDPYDQIAFDFGWRKGRLVRRAVQLGSVSAEWTGVRLARIGG
jgi:hypothetical protein